MQVASMRRFVTKTVLLDRRVLWTAKPSESCDALSENTKRNAVHSAAPDPPHWAGAFRTHPSGQARVGLQKRELSQGAT